MKTKAWKWKSVSFTYHCIIFQIYVNTTAINNIQILSITEFIVAICHSVFFQSTNNEITITNLGSLKKCWPYKDVLEV